LDTLSNRRETTGSETLSTCCSPIQKRENSISMHSINYKLATRIRSIRITRKLTQAEVAKKCGISASAYGQIERNPSKSSYETLHKVAMAIEVDILYLLDI